MAAQKLKPPFSLSILVLFGAIVLSLHLMSSATQDSSQLGKMYSWLLLINSLGMALLLGLVGANIYWLVRQLRRRAAGSRLTLRMVFLFALIALAPAAIVFYYSMQLLHQSIDSWFDVKIDRAMENALQLSQAALDERMRGLLKNTEQMAKKLENVPDAMVAVELANMRETSEASELTLISKQERIIATSSVNPGLIIPSLPGEGILLRLKQGESYVGLDPVQDQGMQIRAVVSAALDNSRYLQALYPVSLRINQLAQAVESAYAHYQEMIYLRNSLKMTFSLTLSLILLLSLLAAIWAAFLSIRRIVAPVRDLAQGTRAVAEGNYEQRLPVLQKDELGFLVESFNEMTARLARARDEAHRSQREIENQRTYLETILGNLSSGVLSFDARMRLRTANQAANNILHTDVGALAGRPLTALGEVNPNFPPMAHALQQKLEQASAMWQAEVAFLGPNGGQELLCRGTPLFSAEGERSGAVMVFDDVTALIQAQRNAAWSELAQRLAHEIKNPLTPIQLSAERLKHKLWQHLDDSDAEILDRATRTIIQQVEAMKAMLNAFSEYARSPKIQPRRLAMRALIEEVLALYPPQSGVEFHVKLADDLPEIEVDPIRMRQVLHNLIKNAQEAVEMDRSVAIQIDAHPLVESEPYAIEISVRDNGSGIPAEQIERIFDPYMTTKTKGTGLGLAIVKKIIEEHGGAIWVDAAYRDGAGFVIRLPLKAGHAGEPLSVPKGDYRRQTA